MNSIALYTVYSSRVFPLPRLTGYTTSQGVWGLKKTLIDFLKMVPVGHTHGEMLSSADPSGALGCRHQESERRPQHSLSERHTGEAHNQHISSNCSLILI